MFTHHHDITTKILCIDGSVIHAVDFIDDKKLCEEKQVWSLTYDGCVVPSKVRYALKSESTHVADIIINDGEIIIPVYNDNKFYDQNGVIYNYNELHTGQYLGGISKRTIANMRYGGRGFIHQCTGVFKITKITKKEKICDSVELLVDDYYSVSTNSGIFLRTNNPFG